MQTAATTPFVSLFQVIPSEEKDVGTEGSWTRCYQRRTKTFRSTGGNNTVGQTCLEQAESDSIDKAHEDEITFLGGNSDHHQIRPEGG